MKVAIYYNHGKDKDGACKNALANQLDKKGVEYIILQNEDLNDKVDVDALFSIGGDGTILFLSNFACKNQIPVIAINVGRLGFLCEFEKNEIEQAVDNLISGKFVRDYRTTLSVELNGKTYFALNEVYLQRAFDQEVGNMIARFDVLLNGKQISGFSGDGVIVSTPTGSTAYSFSLGGALVLSECDVFSITPIAAHSFNQRPIIYNAKDECCLKVSGKARVGLFVDGQLVGMVSEKDKIMINKGGNDLVFLRKPDSSFYKKLTSKFN